MVLIITAMLAVPWFPFRSALSPGIDDGNIFSNPNRSACQWNGLPQNLARILGFIAEQTIGLKYTPGLMKTCNGSGWVNNRAELRLAFGRDIWTRWMTWISQKLLCSQ